ALDLGLRLVAELECEGHVVAHGHMRIERVVLEHHGDVAPGRRDVIHDALTDAQRSGCDRLESGDHAQRGALSAAGRTDEDDELTVLDVERRACDGDEAVVVDLPHRVETHPGHTTSHP